MEISGTWYLSKSTEEIWRFDFGSIGELKVTFFLKPRHPGYNFILGFYKIYDDGVSFHFQDTPEKMRDWLKLNVFSDKEVTFYGEKYKEQKMKDAIWEGSAGPVWGAVKGISNMAKTPQRMAEAMVASPSSMFSFKLEASENELKLKDGSKEFSLFKSI